MLFNKYKIQIPGYDGRIQKISLNAGLNCPNRDSLNKKGCIFCNNKAFTPFYTSQNMTIVEQITNGIKFFSKKYNCDYYLAYLQSYTNTNSSLQELKKIYQPILNDDRLIGIVIGTRPDTLSENLLDYLSELNKQKYVKLEMGIESLNDKSLAYCNRGHTSVDSINTLKVLSEYNLEIGVHIILGLPYESENSIIEMAKSLSQFDIQSIKIHQLQILTDTRLEEIYQADNKNIKLYTVNEYLEHLIMFLEYLSPLIGIERIINEVPQKYLVAPKWGGIRYNEIVALLKKMLTNKKSYQGKYYI